MVFQIIVIQISRSLKIPNRYKKILFTPLTCSWARTPTLDDVHANSLRLAATVTIFKSVWWSQGFWILGLPWFFNILKQVPIYFSCLLECRFTVNLQKCFVDVETYVPSTWGWVDDASIVIFRWTYPLIYFIGQYSLLHSTRMSA